MYLSQDTAPAGGASAVPTPTATWTAVTETDPVQTDTAYAAYIRQVNIPDQNTRSNVSHCSFAATLYPA